MPENRYIFDKRFIRIIIPEHFSDRSIRL